MPPASVVTDLANFLQLNQAGLLGVDIFQAQMPPDGIGPDLCTAVLGPYSGLAPVRVQPRDPSDLPSISYQQPRVQIEVRGNKEDFVSAELRAGEAYDILNRIKNTILISGVFYQSVEALQDPYLLRWDENRRPRFVFNLQIHKSYG